MPFETSDLDTLLEQIDGAARLSMIILDAWRDYPFRLRRGEGRGVAGSEGLAQMHAATGTLIEYATAPGAIAADSRPRIQAIPGGRLIQYDGDEPVHHGSLDGAGRL